MSVQLDYPLGITGLGSITGTAYLAASGDAAGVGLTFTENTNRLGYYTCVTSSLTAGLTWIEISSPIVDSLFATIPTSGTIVLQPSNFDANPIGVSLATPPPTAVQIRTEMDSNSTKLANLDTTVSSRLATNGYTAPTTPPTVAQIAAGLFVDGGTNKLKVNTDNSVNIDASGSTQVTLYYTVPQTVVNAYKTVNLIPATTCMTLAISPPLLGTITGFSKLWFTVKKNVNDPDSEALLMIEKTAGLLLVNGEAPTDNSLGSITVANATTGLINITVDQTIMALLPTYTDKETAPVWDCKVLNAGVSTEPVRGRMTITGAVTQALS